MRVRLSSSSVAAASVALLMACGGTPPPFSPSPVPPKGRLSGTVFETTSGLRRPVSGARVLVTDVIEGSYGYGYPPIDLQSDANGRFSVAGLPVGRAVSVVAYRGSGENQVCVVRPTITADTSVEVELVETGAIPETFDSPIVSGVVFESTPEGRRPVAGLYVSYVVGGGDETDAYTRTDANGRYSFCRLPPGSGYLLAECAAKLAGSTYLPVEIRGDAAIDVDVTSWISRCR